MGNSIAKQQAEQGLGLHKFRLHRVIGRGSFGKVRMVEHRETNKTYALKYINKATCIAMRAQNNTLRERDMLEEIDHPFVVNLRFSFQDEYTMYMVMDLMIGGDLRFHMLRRRFVEGVIKFWVAELACAINYLHASRIVHRDIKPDNILMDHQGHVALTDFNIATRVHDNKPHYAMAGTANYMAPEVVSGAGYTYSVDWWSLGVVMYECIYGKRPFRNKKNADELKRALLYEEIQFPIIADVQVSFDCISAMRGFLTKDPQMRLGATGLAGVKAHPFFASINWALLEQKQLEPPFMPASDQSNFDISHDLEEMLLEPEPLDPRKRNAMKKNKCPPEHTLPEYHEITRSFAAFDYIEYERFKSYIDANGCISAVAVDNARTIVQPKHSGSSDSGSATPVLGQLRLDGRPIVNMDNTQQLVYFSRSRTSTQVASSNTPPLSQQLHQGRRPLGVLSPMSDDHVSPLEAHPFFRRRLSEAKRRGSVGNSTESMRTSTLSPNSGPSPLLAHSHSVFASASVSPNDNNSPVLNGLASPPSSLPKPQLVGTLEPPSIVPIDILTWNQLLPEQRSLAHRYCVKMAHDRQRSHGPAVGLRPQAPQHIASGYGKIALAYSHRHTPSASNIGHQYAGRMATGAVKAGGRPDEHTALLTARERRKSLMKRQHSVDNISDFSTSIPALAEYKPFDISFGDLSTPARLEDSALSIEHSQHYRHQPLPPPPPPMHELPPKPIHSIPSKWL